MKTKKTMKVGFMAMQLDMSKVYDRVEWVWCEPQSTRFETQQKYWNTCPRKLKFRFLIENPDPTFIIKTWTKGISITPWPSDYNWITNQRYKIWTPQERIPDKFTVLEEPKEEQNLTFSDFLFNNIWKTFTDLDDYLRAP